MNDGREVAQAIVDQARDSIITDLFVAALSYRVTSPCQRIQAIRAVTDQSPVPRLAGSLSEAIAAGRRFHEGHKTGEAVLALTKSPTKRLKFYPGVIDCGNLTRIEFAAWANPFHSHTPLSLGGVASPAAPCTR